MTPAEALEPQMEPAPPLTISICAMLLVVKASSSAVPLVVLGSFRRIPSISTSTCPESIPLMKNEVGCPKPPELATCIPATVLMACATV